MFSDIAAKIYISAAPSRAVGDAASWPIVNEMHLRESRGSSSRAQRRFIYLFLLGRVPNDIVRYLMIS